MIYYLHLKLVIYLLYIYLKFDIILLLNNQEAGDLFVLDVCGKFGIMLLSCKLQVSDVFASDICSKFNIILLSLLSFNFRHEHKLYYKLPILE